MAKMYDFLAGARCPVDAQTMGEQCAALESQGRLTAEELVNVSRPEDSPTHKAFEWDDAVAGELYRKEQARSYIRAIVVLPDDEESEPQKLYYNIVRAEPNYKSINTIMESEDDTERLLGLALAELIRAKNKYKNLKQLADVFRAIDDAQIQFEEMQAAK